MVSSIITHMITLGERFNWYLVANKIDQQNSITPIFPNKFFMT